MATQAQIDANRRNAQKSTGPKTVNGKRIVANNALKHGLCSEEALIAGEDPETFAQFADHLRLHMEEDDLCMRNVMLIERVILLRWKLRRMPRLERLAMEKLVAEHGDGDEALLAGLVGDAKSATLFRLQQYEMRLNRELRACMNEFRTEYSNRSSSDCHKSYCEGYNKGVRDQADLHRGEAKVAEMQPRERQLEAVDVPYGDLIVDGVLVEDAAMSPEVTACHIDAPAAAEQSQFASWQENLQDPTPTPRRGEGGGEGGDVPPQSGAFADATSQIAGTQRVPEFRGPLAPGCSGHFLSNLRTETRDVSPLTPTLSPPGRGGNTKATPVLAAG